jgi:hypothetical protein
MDLLSRLGYLPQQAGEVGSIPTPEKDLIKLNGV